MAAIYRRSGEWLKKNVESAVAMDAAKEFVATLNEPVLLVDGDKCWEVGDGYAEEQEEWSVDE